MSAKSQVLRLLQDTDIQMNGKKQWDIKVHNEQLYQRILSEGSLGFGEAYMDGWWDCDSIDMLMQRLVKANLQEKVMNWKTLLAVLKAKFINRQTKARSKKVAEEHYDLGNEFYKDMLDKNMQYTCGYWKTAKTLDKAQEAKLDLVCKKLELKKGETVLELGCGWGGFAYYAAKKYKVHVTAVNISKEQVDYARKKCKGLPVTILQSDYRDVQGKFDKVASIGMCEHVGYKNYPILMKKAFSCLKDDGLFLLHTIGGNKSVKNTDRWIEKYIFPNSMLPSIKQLAGAMEGLFVMEDWHNFGTDYDKTLMQWYKNFKKNWPKHKEQYGERFYRMWSFYLLCCAGMFRARKIQLWQVVMSKSRQQRYNSPR